MAGHRGAVRTRTIVAPMVVAALVGLAAWDATRPPGRQIGVRAACAVLELHRSSSAVWLMRSGVRCRFDPSCSVYAERVLEDRGWLTGAPLIIYRISRCGPWTAAGTSDPWPSPTVAPSIATPLPSQSPSVAAKE